MRQHISKALQTHSAAIKAAIERYNAAASALIPPRWTIEWSEVMEATFLTEFDLLCDTCQDISQRPWATPVGRMAMDLYFKVCRAPEEIEHCNVEIRRVCTFLHDKEHYLWLVREQTAEFNEPLAHQIHLLHLKHERFAAHHYVIFTKLTNLSGFSGTLTPGISVDNSSRASGTTPEIQSCHVSHISAQPSAPQAILGSPSTSPSHSDGPSPTLASSSQASTFTSPGSSPANTSMMEVDDDP